MNKRFSKYLGLALLLASSLPFSLVYAGTVEEVPTGETTVSSMADDPLKEYKEKAANQVSTLESEPETEASEDKVKVKSSEDTPTSESSKEDLPEKEEQPKPKPQRDGIGPQTMNLIEGTDIDADFALILRTKGWAQNLGTSWSGYGKGQNQLTDDDLAALTTISVDSIGLSSLKGLEHAINLQSLNCFGNQIVSLDISENTKLVQLNCRSNKLSSLDVSKNAMLLQIDCNQNQLTNLDVTKNLSLEILNCELNSITNIDTSKNSQLKTLNVNQNPISSIDVSQNLKLEELQCTHTSVSNLDFSLNTKLKKLICVMNPSLINLVVTGAVDLQEIQCRYTSLTTLDVSKNSKLETLKCDNCQLTSLIVAGATALRILECGVNNLPDLDVSQNKKLVNLSCERNQLTNLTIAGADELIIVSCYSNQLTFLDASQNSKLAYLSCNGNKITDLNLVGANSLISVECQENNLPTLDVSQNKKLEILNCQKNQLTNFDIIGADVLKQLFCDDNKLSSLDVSQHTKLENLTCDNNQLVSLTVSGADELKELSCNNNKLTSLDVHQNTKLQKLKCTMNTLTNLSLNGANDLSEINCDNNQLVNLDVSQLLKLRTLSCSNNDLTSLVVAGADVLESLNCANNELPTLDVSQNGDLKSLDFRYNRISDITSLYGLNQLSLFYGSNQSLSIPVPKVTNNQAVVDLLKSTNHSGLTVFNGSITGSPILTPNGDLIELSSVTRESLDGKHLGFNYNGYTLIEGAASGQKSFSGQIHFYSVSDLDSQLESKKKKVYSGDNIDWKWTITNLGKVKSEDIRAILSLPSGLVVDASSIKINGTTGSVSDIDGTSSLGDLLFDQTLEITFKTTATGNAEEWIKAKGELKWKDTTPSSPHNSQTKGEVQILDDEQTFTKNGKALAITSVPIRFNHGIWKVQTTAKSYGLDSIDYQSNTKVDTEGFHARVEDDRAINSGWKLTVKLSDFKNSANELMPNSKGTQLKLENMSIERVTDRDTPQEVIDPAPSGADVPSSVQSTETLVAGQPTAKTLVSAQPNEGQDTWQLRMPFDDISLNLPANAGKKGTVYKAKLTWSLDDTP